jgi:hypothetical protein
MEKPMERRVLKVGDCFYGSCWNKTLKMAFSSNLVLRLFYKWLYHRTTFADVGIAATVLLSVYLVILLLMIDTHEV